MTENICEWPTPFCPPPFFVLDLVRPEYPAKFPLNVSAKNQNNSPMSFCRRGRDNNIKCMENLTGMWMDPRWDSPELGGQDAKRHVNHFPANRNRHPLEGCKGHTHKGHRDKVLQAMNFMAFSSCFQGVFRVFEGIFRVFSWYFPYALYIFRRARTSYVRPCKILSTKQRMMTAQTFLRFPIKRNRLGPDKT